jgi:hypothetical protein
VLLAVRPRLFAEAMRERLEFEPDLEVAGERADPVDAFFCLNDVEADVVIHSWPDAACLPGYYGLWVDRRPGLTICSVSPGALRVLRGGRTVSVVPGSSLSSLLVTLRHAVPACPDVRRAGSTGWDPVLRRSSPVNLPDTRIRNRLNRSRFS